MADLKLDELKVDPSLWMRLATPQGNSGSLKSVFPGTKNPFTEDGANAAYARIQQLASEGKLYVREYGRSRHFRKAEPGEDGLKLSEDVTERKISGYSDPFRGGLLWISQKFFNGIGWKTIGNWFGRMRKRHNARTDRHQHYKAEYKTLSSRQKKDLKSLRKSEKELAKATERLKKLQEQTAAAQRKLDQLLSKDGKGNPAMNQQPVQQPAVNEDPNAQINQDQIQQQQPPLQQQQQPPLQQQQPNENNEIHGQPNEGQEQQQRDPNANIDAPLQNAPDLNGNQINMHVPHPENDKPTVQQRLANEKEALDAAMNWGETTAKALFSRENGQDLMEKYNAAKGNLAESRKFLAGIYVGLFSNSAAENGGVANHRRMLDALLDGRPLGADNDAHVRNSMNKAEGIWQSGNKQEMAGMVADTVRILASHASKEPLLSPRHIMISKFISNALLMARKENLEIKFNEVERTAIQGAHKLGIVAKNYYDARQKLGNGSIKDLIASGDPAVKDLLVGSAVNAMMQQDRSAGERTVTSTQILLGKNVWNVEHLSEVANNSSAKREITEEKVQKLLDAPVNGKDAFAAGVSVMDGLTKEIKQMQAGNHPNAMQLDNQAQINQQPQINQPGPVATG